MNSPTHTDIANKAYDLWEKRGSSHGADVETWLEAETQLKTESKDETDSRDSKIAQSHPTVAQHAIAPSAEERQTIVTEVQKQQARAPQVPHHNAPKPQPAPPGKPIWSKGHSA